MILDEHGRPVSRGNAFICPKWMPRESTKALLSAFRGNLVFARQVSRLLGPDGRPVYQDGPHVGDTITVKTPERFR